MLASDAAKYNTIEPRVTAKTAVTMDASRKLARSVETSKGLVLSTTDAGVQVDLEATHAIMNYWRDDGASYRQGGCSHGCLRKLALSVETSNGPIICTNAAGEQVV